MMLDNAQKNRITELDFFRGIALILMICFHIVRSMNELYNYDVSYISGIHFYIGKLSAILFILVSGIVFSLGRFKRKRFFLLAGLAIAISGVTYMYGKDYGINFGILHFFAVSSVLAMVFSKTNKYILIAIGIGIIGMGSRVSSISMQSDYLFFLGLVSKTFQSADYYPLIPRFGLYLIGMGISKIFYSQPPKKSVKRNFFGGLAYTDDLSFVPQDKRNCKYEGSEIIADFESSSVYTEKKNIFGKVFNVSPINFIGRNTLLIYIIHQPIIIGILYLLQFARS